MDAILVGAIGDPRVPVGLLERAIIAGIRFGLDLYVNLRPVKLFAEHLCPEGEGTQRRRPGGGAREHGRRVRGNRGPLQGRRTRWRSRR